MATGVERKNARSVQSVDRFAYVAGTHVGLGIPIQNAS